MPTFNVEHLGCKVNQYEAEALRQGLERLGLRAAPEPSAADLYVLNTCSVTAHAGATSRKLVRRALRGNARARILVTGCYAESDRSRLEAMGGVERVFGNAEKEEVLTYVAGTVLDLPPDQGAARFRISRMGGHTRAFVKIEDGCDDRCTFCIIPRLRGPARSRPEDEIVAEVADLVAGGHREVVLTGVHLGFYGKERRERGRALRGLLERLARVPGLARLKLSSLEVHELDDELVDLFASEPVLCPHFHLPLQSGSDRVLRRMRRKYTAERFLERVGRLRAGVPDAALSTDVIVGFPGETEEDFQETVGLVQRARFMKLHVFPYSVREGTEAAYMGGHLPAGVVGERKRRLLAVGDGLAAAFRREHVGRVVEVLVEGRRDGTAGRLSGLTPRYLRVLLEGPDRLQGGLVDVLVGGEGPDGCVTGRLQARETVP